MKALEIRFIVDDELKDEKWVSFWVSEPKGSRIFRSIVPWIVYRLGRCQCRLDRWKRDKELVSWLLLMISATILFPSFRLDLVIEYSNCDCQVWEKELSFQIYVFDCRFQDEEWRYEWWKSRICDSQFRTCPLSSSDRQTVPKCKT